MPSMHIPDLLRDHRTEIDAALAVPVLATWDEEETYHNADDVTAIGDILVEAVHPDLLPASIAYIFREKIKTRDRIVWGKAGKAGSKIEFFNGFDFLIEINWTQWKLLSPMQRFALVDHELEHCGSDINEKGERSWVMVSHSIEEFGGIVTRWGLWHHDLKVFANAVTHAEQIGMFEEALD